MTRGRGLLGAACALGLAVGVAAPASAATPASASAPAPPAVRVEARSADLLAVGLVQGDRMTIHVTHIADNSPVRDARITVLLRGIAHATVADADGGYSFASGDLALPGTAAIIYEIAAGTQQETLQGALTQAGAAPQGEDKNSARQLWWWVLNFAVCGGFLWLWSKRRKDAPPDDA